MSDLFSDKKITLDRPLVLDDEWQSLLATFDVEHQLLPTVTSSNSLEQQLFIPMIAMGGVGLVLVAVLILGQQKTAKTEKPSLPSTDPVISAIHGHKKLNPIVPKALRALDAETNVVLRKEGRLEVVKESVSAQVLTDENVSARQPAASILLKKQVKASRFRTVRSGDTMWSIARAWLGVPAAWIKLAWMNPHLKNPHFLSIGDKVYLPPGPKKQLKSQRYRRYKKQN
jgi:hypothetical protein